MERTLINPWSWQDHYGFSQAWEIVNPGSVLEISGQTSVNAEGEVQHANDFSAQTHLVFENLKTVLEEAGAGTDDVVKLGAYVTDRSYVEEYSRIQASYFPDASPAQTLLVVEDLALPGLKVEVEATAYR